MEKDKRHLIAGFTNMLNALIILIVLTAKMLNMDFPFIYFTTLSNILCGACNLIAALFLLKGRMPRWVLLLDQIGTSAIALTLMTVLLFLGPTFGFGLLLSGGDLFYHLICPVLALISFILLNPAVERELGFLENLCGMIPMLIYGTAYFRHVVILKDMPDIYYFTYGGNTLTSIIGMLLLAFAVNVMIWLLRRLDVKKRTAR